MSTENKATETGMFECTAKMIRVHRGAGRLPDVYTCGEMAAKTAFSKDGKVNWGYLRAKGCPVRGHVMYVECASNLTTCEYHIDLRWAALREEVTCPVVDCSCVM